MSAGTNLARLWSDRRRRALRETLPYWRYVMSSGGLAMGFAFILLIQGYASTLARARAIGDVDAWVTAAAAALAALALLWNPARTLLRPPDTVFLMPAEIRMGAYFRGAWIYGGMLSAGAVGAVLLLYAPFLAATGASAAGYAFAALLLLALKALLYAGAWKERQFRSRGVRASFYAAKAAGAFVTAHALLSDGRVGLEHAWLLALWGAYVASLRLPGRYRVNWEHLIELDRRAVSLQEMWFGFFVDLPNRTESFRPRAYLNGLLKLVGYGRERSFHYLYWRSLLRSTMAAMVARLIALEAAIVWLFPQLWAAVSVYAVFAWLIGLQLRGLRAAPAEPLLAAMSPLPEEHRARALRSVGRTANIVAALLLAVPLALWVPAAAAAACALAGIASALLFSAVRARA